MRLLYLMRHGEASFDAPTDELRPLTERGKQSVAAAATYLLEKLDDEPTVIASPLVRAQETAAIMRDELHIDTGTSTSGEVTPGGSPAAVCEMLSALEGDVLVVTHQPLIGRLITFLTGEEAWLDTANMVAVRVEVFDREMGEIAWMYFGSE